MCATRELMLDLKLFNETLGATVKALITPMITLAFAAAAWTLFYIHTRGWFPLPPTVAVAALIVRLRYPQTSPLRIG